MAETNSSFLKNALNGGLILGLIQVIYSVILYILDIMPIGFKMMGIMLVISLAIYFVVILYTTKSYRNNVLGGYISFGQAFLFGLLVAVFAAILVAIYNYIFYSWIDPEYAGKVVSASKEWTENFMVSKGVSESQISDAMDKIDEKGVVTPLKTMRQALVGGAIFGAIVSLITGAIAKKNKDIIEG
jgi:hypothetical protein